MKKTLAATLPQTQQEKPSYPEKDLCEFRVCIDEQIEKKQNNLEGSQRNLSSLKEDLREGRLDSNQKGPHVLKMESVSTSMSKTMDLIKKLKQAKQRTYNGDYGVCRVTGKLIKKGRLKIVPHATLSIEAKNRQN